VTDPAPELFQRWYHSFEEDTDEEEVWRPEDFPLPPSRRPRPSMEFQPDWILVEYRPGPADQAVPTQGRWEPGDGDRITVQVDDTSRELEIVSYDQQVLRIRK
jgi:hypothetical protein